MFQSNQTPTFTFRSLENREFFGALFFRLLPSKTPTPPRRVGELLLVVPTDSSVAIDASSSLSLSLSTLELSPPPRFSARALFKTANLARTIHFVRGSRTPLPTALKSFSCVFGFRRPKINHRLTASLSIYDTFKLCRSAARSTPHATSFLLPLPWKNHGYLSYMSMNTHTSQSLREGNTNISASPSEKEPAAHPGQFQEVLCLLVECCRATRRLQQ